MEQTLFKNYTRKKILIADDEEINRQILASFLEDEYEILFAEDGEKTIEVLRNEGLSISLVLLDLLMPGINGVEVLKFRQKDAELAKVPFIVATSEKAMEIECLRLGAVDFIAKPYDAPEIIKARVKRIIELYESLHVIDSTIEDPISGLYTRNFFRLFVEKAVEGEEKEFDIIALRIGDFPFLKEIVGLNSLYQLVSNLGSFLKNWSEIHGGFASHDHDDLFFLFIEKQPSYEAFYADLEKELLSRRNGEKIHPKIGVYPHIGEGSAALWCDRALMCCRSITRDPRKKIAIYDENFHQTILTRERLIRDFDAAIKEKQFSIVYQPKYGIQEDTPTLNQAEALVRWNHPELGFISPGVFVPIFERNGLIQKLDAYVFKEVAKQIHEWKERGYRITVSVNLSRVDIYEPDLVDSLCSLMKENHLSTEDMHVEITESAYAEDTITLKEVVSSLREKGFQIEVDDFGSGYSSLNAIADLPFDVLKLDMAFIRSMDKGQKNKDVIALVMDLAKKIGIKVVAEGVETKEQCDFLKSLGCDYVQGYYFSKPLSPKEMEALLEKEQKK